MVSLKESRAIADMAELLYSYLPGSGSPGWKGHVSFKSVAEKSGVGEFWQPGSKLPMITALLQKTLEHRRGQFERLIMETVRAGLTYRHKQGNPILPSEVEKLNGHLLDVGFKFPDLWDQDFLASLRLDSSGRARKRVEEALAAEERRVVEQSRRASDLQEIREQFFELHSEPSPQRAGYKFEGILNRMFALHGLAPREPFRVVGEQIDGSFDLDHETYLVEAKWERTPTSQDALLVFRGKIEGKSAFTRGVFISLSGVSDQARQAITRGKQPTFFAIDGYDLTMVLSGQIGLIEFLRQRRRILAEEGQITIPFSQLWVRPRDKSG